MASPCRHAADRFPFAHFLTRSRAYRKTFGQESGDAPAPRQGTNDRDASHVLPGKLNEQLRSPGMAICF